MKSLSVKLGVILFIIGLIISYNVEVWGADWKAYGASEIMGVYYYDASSITHPSKNIVRVWDKIVFSERGVIDAAKKLGERYKNTSFAISLTEFECIKKKTRILKCVFYSKDERIILPSSEQPSKTEWDFIIPGTMADTLHNAVCK